MKHFGKTMAIWTQDPEAEEGLEVPGAPLKSAGR